MRKLLLPALVLAALIVACENKTPNGPDGVGPGGVTVSLTTTTTTTSTSTTTTTVPAATPAPGSTTTSVVGSLSRRFITLNAAPNVPSDMTLFFQLLTSSLTSLPSLAGRLPFVGEAITTATEIRYKVTGVYVTTNNTTGNIEGDLFGAVDPLQNGGEFHGVLTTTVSGCTAERVFRGPMGPGSMNLQGGEMIRDCPGSPLSFTSVNMTQSNSPPPPPATTTTPTTTTTTTTTSIPPCTFTVAPATVPVPDTATTSSVAVTASAATCTWTAQAATPFLTVNTPTGAGTGTVQFTAAANTNGPARSGTLLVAGQVVTVNQAAPPPADLIPAPSVQAEGSSYCVLDADFRIIVAVQTRNQGLGPASVASFTTLLLNQTKETMSDQVPPLAPSQQDLSIFVLPESCYVSDSSGRRCPFRIAVNGTNAVYEEAAAQANNFVDGACVEFVVEARRTVRTIINRR